MIPQKIKVFSFLCLVTIIGCAGPETGRKSMTEITLPARQNDIRLEKVRDKEKLRVEGIERVAILPFANYSQESFLLARGYANKAILEEVADQFVQHNVLIIPQEDTTSRLVEMGLLIPEKNIPTSQLLITKVSKERYEVLLSERARRKNELENITEFAKSKHLPEEFVQRMENELTEVSKEIKKYPIEYFNMRIDYMRKLMDWGIKAGADMKYWNEGFWKEYYDMLAEGWETISIKTAREQERISRIKELREERLEKYIEDARFGGASDEYIDFLREEIDIQRPMKFDGLTNSSNWFGPGKETFQPERYAATSPPELQGVVSEISEGQIKDLCQHLRVQGVVRGRILEHGIRKEKVLVPYNLGVLGNMDPKQPKGKIQETYAAIVQVRVYLQDSEGHVRWSNRGEAKYVTAIDPGKKQIYDILKEIKKEEEKLGRPLTQKEKDVLMAIEQVDLKTMFDTAARESVKVALTGLFEW